MSPGRFEMGGLSAHFVAGIASHDWLGVLCRKMTNLAA